jgi:hypothetical protein
MRAHVLRAAATAVLVGAGLAGCAGPTTHPAAPSAAPTDVGAPAPAKGARDCSIAPASLVNSVLGTSVGDPEFEEGVPEISGFKDSWGCHYNDFTLVVDFARQVAPADIARLKDLAAAAGTVADLPGFADQAFTMTTSGGAVTLVARKDSRMVEILSGAPLDKEKALVQKLFSRF